jgi:formate hydrogenlyase subunit 3/multisubunit Na+/H+ antiporter MnhD subunit
MPTTTTTPAAGGKTIFSLMFFAIGFSLLGNEIKVAKEAKPLVGDGPANPLATGTGAVVHGITVSGRIILGGFFATTLLIMLSHAGNPGREWAVGLASVTTVASVFVYGGPVWTEANKLFGSTPTTPLASTSATAPTSTTGATTTTHTSGTTAQTGATS